MKLEICLLHIWWVFQSAFECLDWHDFQCFERLFLQLTVAHVIGFAVLSFLSYRAIGKNDVLARHPKRRCENIFQALYNKRKFAFRLAKIFADKTVERNVVFYVFPYFFLLLFSKKQTRRHILTRCHSLITLHRSRCIQAVSEK